MEDLIKEFEERFDKYCRVKFNRPKDDIRKNVYCIIRRQDDYMLEVEGFSIFLPPIVSSDIFTLFEKAYDVIDRELVSLNIRNATRVEEKVISPVESEVKKVSIDYDECLSCQ